MLEILSRHITQWLIKKKVILEDDSEVYEYGLFQLIMNVIDICTIFLLAICFQEIFSVICFVVSFALLRKYAGGYHANTVLRCYLVTTIATVLAILWIKFVVVPFIVILGIWVVSGITIVLLAPVSNRNKILDDVEYVVYRKKALSIWGVECVIMLLFKFIGFEKCFEGNLIGQCYVALAMCIEVLSFKSIED